MKRYLIYAVAGAVVTAPAFLDTSVLLQPTFPGTAQAGHTNITGTARAGSMVGYSNELSAIAYGGDFRSISTSGRGVLGNASATSGATYGGLFQAASTGGRGIAGFATATIGTTYGGFFSSASVQGRAVYGQATADSGVNYGVYGTTNSPSGFAGFFDGNLKSTGIISGNGSELTNLVAGNIATGTLSASRLPSSVPLKASNNDFNGTNRFFGGFETYNLNLGAFLDPDAFGVHSSTTHSGVRVSTESTSRVAFVDYTNGNNTVNTQLFGALFRTRIDGTTRMAINVATGEIGIGTEAPISRVDIRETRLNEAAIVATNGNPTLPPGGRTGVVGTSTGTDSCYGVYGYANSSNSESYGVFGFAGGPDSINVGVYGAATEGTTNFAGWFNGHLQASSASSGVKSFLIDHPLDPENKFLEHSSVESDQRMNVYRGIVVTDGRGYANIKLPNWFSALNKEMQYQLTVIDTADSDDFVLAKVVKEFDGVQFRIRTSSPSIRVNWLVTGVRHDPTSEYMPLEVEREKTGAQRGKYLIPEAFGKGQDRAMVSGQRKKSAGGASAK